MSAAFVSTPTIIDWLISIGKAVAFSLTFLSLILFYVAERRLWARKGKRWELNLTRIATGVATIFSLLIATSTLTIVEQRLQGETRGVSGFGSGQATDAPPSSGAPGKDGMLLLGRNTDQFQSPGIKIIRISGDHASVILEMIEENIWYPFTLERIRHYIDDTINAGCDQEQQQALLAIKKGCEGKTRNEMRLLLLNLRRKNVN